MGNIIVVQKLREGRAPVEFSLNTESKTYGRKVSFTFIPICDKNY